MNVNKHTVLHKKKVYHFFQAISLTQLKNNINNHSFILLPLVSAKHILCFPHNSCWHLNIIHCVFLWMFYFQYHCCTSGQPKQQWMLTLFSNCTVGTPMFVHCFSYLSHNWLSTALRYKFTCGVGWWPWSDIWSPPIWDRGTVVGMMF